jgi:hypothetical protein
MSATIVQVLPRLDAFGVANHARRLAAGLERATGMRSSFVTTAVDSAPLPAGDVRVVPARSSALARELARSNGSPVLLHYSNYGYQKRGCPTWLLAGVAGWRRRTSRGRLITIFHELYATGRPWQSSFWLSPLQRRLARRMRSYADVTVTSLPRYRTELARWRDAQVTELPVFSTIGEPAQSVPLAARRPRLVVFGSAGLRSRAYRTGSAAIARAAAATDVTEVLDIGGGNVAPPRVANLPVRAIGEQSDATISELLADSRVGFLAYPADFLGKSTVFAAYCAHRLLPAVWWRRAAEHPAPRWNADRPLQEDVQALADRALAWYAPHALARQVDLYASLIR